MNKSHTELIQEEQRILNGLIREMDLIVLKLNKKLTMSTLQIQKARSKCLPDTYGLLVTSRTDQRETKARLKELKKSRDELYSERILLEYQVENGEKGLDDIKVGLHSYGFKGKTYIMSWKMPLCRHYTLDNSTEDFELDVIDKGIKYHTYYKMKMRRDVELHFDTVKNVNQLFPIIDNTEIKVVDKFLLELLNRRSQKEFQNIVFSIQKQQSDIIQLPFQENMIVQGCAGSGKSMIMLHRLPIVLYDNPETITRSNLFIITPSITYMQVANNMRIELEIEDIKMGTLEQYYDYVIQKYGYKSEVYGTIKPYLKLPYNIEKYIYSKECIKDIKNEMEEAYGKRKRDYTWIYKLLNIDSIQTRSNLYVDKILTKIINIDSIIETNKNNVYDYYEKIRNLSGKLLDFSQILTSRKMMITREVWKRMTRENDLIKSKKRELEEIDKEAHKIAYKNREFEIAAAEKRIEDLQRIQIQIDLDDQYFNRLQEAKKYINQFFELLPEIKKKREEMKIEELYQCIQMKDEICSCYQNLNLELIALGDPYTDYVESIPSYLRKMTTIVNNIELWNKPHLQLNIVNELNETNKYYKHLQSSLIEDIYLSFMKKLGQEPDEKKNLTALKCSPYLYLQILYCFQGMPNAGKEALITIDEAQNLMPEELKLIKAVNGNQVVFNLFGDVKQHIEDTKGITDWNEIQDIAEFTFYNIKENYRNAKQITDYCNRRFNLDMHAINLDGAGVHIIEKPEELLNMLRDIFAKPLKSGLSCIIVKNKEEAISIISLISEFQGRINNMTEDYSELHPNKWNLMTVAQSKGLEFETIIAVTGRMTQNEKYITYTRATDELYIIDYEISLTKINREYTKDLNKQSNIRNKKKEKRKRISDIKGIEGNVKAFFEEAGYEVIDLRNKTGFLWVIGERKEIENIVNQAIEKFGITGGYACNKATDFRQGWYTKTKK